MKKSRFNSFIVAVAMMLMSVQSAWALDAALPDYAKASGVSGQINSVGSDTLANLMTFWAEGFKKQYPNISIQIQAAGSSTAPPALIENTSNFGPMSRAMKSKELADFEARHGYKPTAFPVAIDAIALYVNKDNPVVSLSIPQVDGIFSTTRKCGYSDPIDSWGNLGLEGDWAIRDIQIFGRNSVSGTYGYFKKVALCKGDYKNTVNEQPGSAAVVNAVSNSINGIGYSGIGYRTAGVRLLPISKKDGGTAYLPETENIISGQYPVSRFLWMYINKAPNSNVTPLVREFIRFVFSKEGQAIVEKDGFVPVSAQMAEEALSKLGS